MQLQSLDKHGNCNCRCLVRESIYTHYNVYEYIYTMVQKQKPKRDHLYLQFYMYVECIAYKIHNSLHSNWIRSDEWFERYNFVSLLNHMRWINGNERHHQRVIYFFMSYVCLYNERKKKRNAISVFNVDNRICHRYFYHQSHLCTRFQEAYF